MDGTAVSEWVSGLGIWPLVVLLAINLYFRHFGKAGQKKRVASLLQAIAVFVITSLAALVMERGLTDLVFWSGTAFVFVIMLIFHRRFFPYRFRCTSCGETLSPKNIYFLDSNRCSDCEERQV